MILGAKAHKPKRREGEQSQLQSNAPDFTQTIFLPSRQMQSQEKEQRMISTK